MVITREPTKRLTDSFKKKKNTVYGYNSSLRLQNNSGKRSNEEKVLTFSHRIFLLMLTQGVSDVTHSKPCLPKSTNAQHSPGRYVHAQLKEAWQLFPMFTPLRDWLNMRHIAYPSNLKGLNSYDKHPLTESPRTYNSVLNTFL